MPGLRIAILASHEGTTAQAVMDACAAGAVAGDVVLVISNNRESGALRRAAAAGVPWLHASGRTHPDADDLGAAVSETGASVHVVSANYDEGSVLRQEVVRVLPDDSVASLGARVRDVEKRLLVEVLAAWPS